jgi:hypothetical protein
MGQVGSLLQFIGGTVLRVVATALFIGVFFVLFGVLPWEFAVRLLAEPPAWLLGGWFRLGVLIVGLFIIYVAVRYNLWSTKQQAIDDLSEDISWAIHNLVNRNPRPNTNAEVAAWEQDYNDWCARVSQRLGNRAFFTRSDQIHFDQLGFVEPVHMSGLQPFDGLLAQLRLKFDRLRDVINWTQMRRR